MITDITRCIDELQKRVESFKEQEPTEFELRLFSEDYLLLRRTLTQLDRDLTKTYDDYSIFYSEWTYRHEREQQTQMDAWEKCNQLEISFEH